MSGMERITFQARIDESGNLVSERPNETRGRLVRFVPKKDRRVTVTVGRYVKPKSNPQLALFHGPILAAWSEFCGYDLYEMKRELKRAFLAPQLAVSRLTGVESKELPSLGDLNADEMRTFLDVCIREGHQRGIEFAIDPAAS